VVSIIASCVANDILVGISGVGFRIDVGFRVNMGFGVGVGFRVNYSGIGSVDFGVDYL